MSAEEIEEVEDVEGSEDGEGEEEGESSEEEARDADIEQLIEAVANNPAYYDGHVFLIQQLRHAGNVPAARSARETMAENFPLSEELWSQWIDDELSACTEASDFEFVLELCQRATQDYLSVALWLQYVTVAQSVLVPDLAEALPSDENRQKLRGIFEQALAACSLHVSAGGLIWDAFRDFEMHLLDALSSQSSPDTQQQRDLVASLFRRQLSIPLRNAVETLQQYQEWMKGLGEEPVAAVVQSAESTLKQLEERLPFEAALEVADGAQAPLEAWQSYVAFEMEKRDPARVVCLFERALKEHCLLADMWQEYGKYVDYTLKSPKQSVKLYERAVRNCTWSGLLWSALLRAMERGHGQFAQEEMIGVVKRGVNATGDRPHELAVFALACFMMLRHTPNKEALTKLLNGTHKAMESADEEVLFTWTRRAAMAYAADLGDVEAGRKLYEEVLRRRGKVAQSWLEFITFEQTYGDKEKCRGIFKRGLNVVSAEAIEFFGAEWYLFESLHGTVEQWDAAHQRIEPKVRDVREKQAKELAEAAATQAAAPKGRRKKEAAAKADAEAGGSKAANTTGKKRSRAEAGLDDEKKEGGVATEESSEPPEAKRAKVEPVAAVNPENYRSTVFIRQLSDKSTDAEVRELFAKYGEIKVVSLPTDRIGNRKTHALVEFATEDSARAAIGSSGALHGWTFTVIPCERPAELIKSGTQEPRTLHVGNVSFNLTEEQVREFFAKVGDVKEIRMPKEGRGRHKGFAYVEFADEAGATAGLKLDGTLLDERPLKVALSQPPMRQRGASHGGSGRGSGTERGGRGRGFDRSERTDRDDTEFHGRPGLGFGSGRGTAGRRRGSRMTFSTRDAEPMEGVTTGAHEGVAAAAAPKSDAKPQAPPPSAPLQRDNNFFKNLMKKGT